VPTCDRSLSNPTVTTLFPHCYRSCSVGHSAPYSAYRYGGCIHDLQPVPSTRNKLHTPTVRRLIVLHYTTLVGWGSANGYVIIAPTKVTGRTGSADSMPVSTRLAMSARVLSSISGCASSPDVFRSRGPLRTISSHHRSAARGNSFSERTVDCLE
jgi:hypothetical protein